MFGKEVWLGFPEQAAGHAPSAAGCHSGTSPQKYAARDDINYWVAAEEGYEKGRIGLRVTLPVPRLLHSAKGSLFL
jgi:hypothetical protein